MPPPAAVPSLTGSCPPASEACAERPAWNEEKSSSAYGLASTKDEQREHKRHREPPSRRPEGLSGGVADERADQAEQRDPAGVLGRRGEADAEPGDHVVAPASPPEHPGDPVQRQGDGRQRRHVVERKVAVEDRQEGQTEDRRRQQPDGPVEEPRAGQVGEPYRGRAEHRRDDPRDHEHLGRIGGVGADDGVCAPEPQLEHDVQQVGIRGRVEEVVGVEIVREEGDRPRNEMRRLVNVVAVGQTLPDSPQAQHEGEHEQQRPARGR